MKKRITVASAVVAAAAAVTSALLARRARFFAQAPRRNETFATTAGPVELPVRYHDGSLMGGFWLVEETKAAALLPDNLEPLLLPGRNAEEARPRRVSRARRLPHRRRDGGPPRGQAAPVPLLDERHSHAAAAWRLYGADAAGRRNAARELPAGPGADPARRRTLPHRRLPGAGGLRDLEY